MTFDLASMVRRAKPGMRRRAIVIRDIQPPATLASDLYAVYAQAVDVWSRAAPRIADEYARTLAGMTRDSAEDLTSQINAAEAEFNRLMLVLTPELRRWAVRVEAHWRGRWAAAVKAATDIDISMLIGPDDVRETLGTYISWNTNLIRDVSDQARKRISDAVFSGLNERKPARDVAAEIREAVAMGRRRSMGIAADQLSKASAALSQERRRQAGLSIYKYRHSGKKHPRDWHRARNEKLYAENEADVGKVIDGKTVNAPIDASDRAGIPPWCGCREMGVLILE